MVDAGFLAVAMSVATVLVAPAQQARATAVLLPGVTLSCVAGVLAGALLGEWSGWRSAFWAVAVLCLPAPCSCSGRRPPTWPVGTTSRSAGKYAR